MHHILMAILSVNRVLIPLIIGLDYMLPVFWSSAVSPTGPNTAATPTSLNKLLLILRINLKPINLAKVIEALQLKLDQQHCQAENQIRSVWPPELLQQWINEERNKGEYQLLSTFSLEGLEMCPSYFNQVSLLIIAVNLKAQQGHFMKCFTLSERIACKVCEKLKLNTQWNNHSDNLCKHSWFSGVSPVRTTIIAGSKTAL